MSLCACIDLGLCERLLALLRECVRVCVSVVWEPTVHNQLALCLVGVV